MSEETHAAGRAEAAVPAAGGKERIVILGGGFAGVYTAMFLERGMTRA